jgi:hypothetical protein
MGEWWNNADSGQLKNIFSAGIIKGQIPGTNAGLGGGTPTVRFKFNG